MTRDATRVGSAGVGATAARAPSDTPPAPRPLLDTAVQHTQRVGDLPWAGRFRTGCRPPYSLGDDHRQRKGLAWNDRAGPRPRSTSTGPAPPGCTTISWA